MSRDTKLIIFVLIIGLLACAFSVSRYFHHRYLRLEREARENAESMKKLKETMTTLNKSMMNPPQLPLPPIQKEVGGGGGRFIRKDSVPQTQTKPGIFEPPQVPFPPIGEGGISLGGNMADSKDPEKNDKPQTRPK